MSMSIKQALLFICLLVGIFAGGGLWLRSRPITQLDTSIPGLPLYPGARNSTYFDEEMEGAIEHRYRATWETMDTVPTVMQWYVDYKDRGWHLLTAPADPGATGAQDAVFALGGWRVYVVIQSRGDNEPTYIYISADEQ